MPSTKGKAKTPAKPAAKPKKKTAAENARPWNGSGVAADQSRRGTKGHSIIDDVPGLAAWLIEQCMQRPRPTLVAIMDRLRGTKFLQQLEDLGHENGLSRSTLGEFVFEWKQFEIQQALELARKRIAVETSRTYNGAGDDEEQFDIDSSIATMVSIDVQERLADARAKGVAIGEDLREDLKVAARYQTARTMRAKARFIINRGLKRIKQSVLQDAITMMNKLLQKEHPEVLPFVRKALETAVNSAVQKELQRE